MTTLDDSLAAIDGAVRDAIMTVGRFESVAMHEPKSAPIDGMSAAAWFQRFVPVGAASGMNIASGLMLYNCRLHMSFMSEPYDDIDRELKQAGAAVMGSFIGGFSLAGTIRSVDIFGANGFGLTMVFGYVSLDNKLFRIADIQIPLIVNDLWTETA